MLVEEIMKKLVVGLLLLLGAGQQALAALAMEPQYKLGMVIQGMYIQSVMMGMDGMDMPEHTLPADASMHLELRLTADKNNPYQFIEGSWIPYAKIDYRVEKDGSDFFTSGTLDPMVANDGPHYGANVKLDGVGKYNIKFRISPPQIMFHIDKETAARKWWKPFIVEWDLVYTGTGKKGGY